MAQVSSLPIPRRATRWDVESVASGAGAIDEEHRLMVALIDFRLVNAQDRLIPPAIGPRGVEPRQPVWLRVDEPYPEGRVKEVLTRFTDRSPFSDVLTR